MLKKKIIRLSTAVLMLAANFFPMFLPIATYADDEPERPRISLVSVDQYGEEIDPEWSDYIYTAANGSGDFGAYYYETANNTDEIRIGVKVEGLEEGESYKIFNDTVLTFENEGEIIYGNMKPNMQQMDDNMWTTYPHEYMTQVFLMKNDDSWTVYDSLNIVTRPAAVGSSDIEILSVKQGEEDLNLDLTGREVQDLNVPQTINEYAVDDYSKPITVQYKVKNLHVGWQYSVNLGNGNSNQFEADESEKIMTSEMNVDVTKKHSQATLSLYGYSANMYGPSGESHSSMVNMYFRMTNENYRELGHLIIDDVKQNGGTVEAVEKENNNYEFSLNDVQGVDLILHATDAMDEVTYYFRPALWNMGNYVSGELVAVTGQELKEGVALRMPSMLGKNMESAYTLNIMVQMARNAGHSSDTRIFYKEDGGEYSYPTIKFNYFEDDNIPRFSAKYGYANNSEVGYAEEGYINAKYHDAENPIKLHIEGEKYADEQEYAVRFKINEVTYDYGTYERNSEKIYEREFVALGSELNSGKDFVLDEYAMTLPEYDYVAGGFVKDVGYDFVAEIDGLTTTDGLYYMFDGRIDSVITYNGGEVNAEGAGGGAGGPYTAMAGASMSSRVFDDNRTATLYYIGRDFEDEVEYDYEIYYDGNGQNFGDFAFSYSEDVKIASGKITGKRLNDGLLGVEMENPGNSDKVSYTLVVKRNGGLIQVMRDDITFWSGPGIESVKLTADRDVYSQIWRSGYMIPKGNDAAITLYGARFDDEKEYTVSVTYNGGYYEDNGYGGQSWSQVDLSELDSENKVLGKDLNAGKAYEIKYIDKMDQAERVGVSFMISDDDEYYPGHYLNIEYVDLEDVLSSEVGYKVSNETGRIKKISELTSLEELQEAITVTGGGTVKVYSADGTTEQTGNIGTGMIVRVVDEYERPVLDMEAVVTGDIAGTSEIEALDLLLMRRHLIGAEELEGAYFEAADVAEDEEIDALDLLTMRRHLIGLEEIK